MASTDIKTRFLIISDTHGRDFLSESCPQQRADVAIHCGDLTDGSTLEEFQATLKLLKSINAPLKLVIAGNHDFTLDIPVFEARIAGAGGPETVDPNAVTETFGSYGQARQLFEDAKDAGIVFLDEGTHRFTLGNGAQVTVYASPFTPSTMGDWGFTYHPDSGHEFQIEKGGVVDVVMTHGPPRGVMDYTPSKGSTGCPNLFAAIARARPRLHCFGHVHPGWGAKIVSWGGKEADVDPDDSILIDELPQSLEDKRKKLDRYAQCRSTSHCADDENSLKFGEQTLFVNAAIQGTEDFPDQPLWLVDIELPRAG